MLERIRQLPHHEELSAFQKAVAIARITHDEVQSALRHTGKAGAPIRFTHNLVGRASLQYLMHKSDFMNGTYNRDFIEELEQLKANESVNNSAQVLYVASGNDTCVQRVFPQTTHLDIRKPWPMPANFNFVKADASAMPFLDSTFNIAVLKHYAMDLNAGTLSEAQRVLRPEGLLIDHQDSPLPAVSMKPAKNPEDAQRQAHRLKTIMDFYRHGFELQGSLRSGSEIYGKVDTDPKKVAQFEEVLSRCKEVVRKKQYEDLMSGKMPKEGAIAFLDNRRPVSGLVLMDSEDYEKELDLMKAEVPPEILSLIKEALDEYRCNEKLKKQIRKGTELGEMKLRHPTLYKIRSIVHAILNS